MAEKPRVRDEIVFRDEGDEGFVFDAHTGAIKVLNEMGMFIWKLCDGTCSEEGMVDMIMEEFDALSREDVQKDVELFLRNLTRNDLLETE